MVPLPSVIVTSGVIARASYGTSATLLSIPQVVEGHRSIRHLADYFFEIKL